MLLLLMFSFAQIPVGAAPKILSPGAEVAGRYTLSTDVLITVSVTVTGPEEQYSMAPQKEIDSLGKFMLPVGRLDTETLAEAVMVAETEAEVAMLVAAPNFRASNEMEERDAVGRERLSVGTARLKLGTEALRVGMDRLRLGMEALRVGTARLRLATEALILGTDRLRLGIDALRVGMERLRLESERSARAILAVEAPVVDATPLDTGNPNCLDGSVVKEAEEEAAAEAPRAGIEMLKLETGTLRVGRLATETERLETEALRVGTAIATDGMETLRVGTERLRLAMDALRDGMVKLWIDAPRVGMATLGIDALTDERERLWIEALRVGMAMLAIDALKVGAETLARPALKLERGSEPRVLALGEDAPAPNAWILPIALVTSATPVLNAASWRELRDKVGIAAVERLGVGTLREARLSVGTLRGATLRVGMLRDATLMVGILKEARLRVGTLRDATLTVGALKEAALRVGILKEAMLRVGMLMLATEKVGIWAKVVGTGTEVSARESDAADP